jgi:hypothetical protein
MHPTVDCGPLMESGVTKIVTSGSNSALTDLASDSASLVSVLS